ncbi:sugar ABC transporter ATP-binding protein [Gracilinema caldarium]|uniref:sugar ABC transporter ATP-binding protein n=1 Tax=Gracilinema caldarium TaxID=215591 RepID=UPI0026E9531D|nr:sugar ABC transporter ATP-binding protein [Gracilinema caldarium]
MDEALLQLSHISMYFPGIKALDDVHITIKPGEVHALIGENGAGKSTLVKIMTGVYKPNSGTIRYLGKEIQFKSPQEAQKAGIAVIHQETAMFADLTVAENIFMGHEPRYPMPNWIPVQPISWKNMFRYADELLQNLGMSIDSHTLVKNLSTAERHLVEIAKALSQEAKILIMDEPTSAITIRETKELFDLVKKLKAQGTAIVFISHKFEELFEIADYYTVLRDGRYIGEGSMQQVTEDELIRMMVGRSIDQLFPKGNALIGEIVLEARNLSKIGVFKDVSFSVHRGEILGFFGLVGAGRSEVMRAMIGIDPLDSGEIIMGDHPCRFKSPQDSMKRGIVYVPEDRQRQGAILSMSIAENISLPQIDALSTLGFLNDVKERALALDYAKKLEVKAAGLEYDVQTLSGGNQQKVVLAKWLASHPSLLILDEPTKGIDVATKSAVHQIISNLADQGLAIILVSSELPEIIGMTDRVIVMHEGRVSASFARKEYKEELIMRAAMGSTVKPVEVA